MFSFKSFQDYIKYLCEVNNHISNGHEGRNVFFRMDEYEQAFSTTIMASSPFVVVNDATGYPIGGEDLGALEWNVVLHFLSTVDIVDGNVSDRIEQARELTFEIMIDFFLRIIFDYENKTGCKDIIFLNAGQMEFSPLGPEGKSEYGWQLKFSFRTALPAYDPNKWRIDDVIYY